MVNDFNALERLKQKDLKSNIARKTDLRDNKFGKGTIVYKRDTGMAFRVVNVSHANGIKHYNLLCSETGTCYYLSRFALEHDYVEEKTNVEKFGMRMVRRLSKMWSK